jgi:hypothetical protein
MVPRWPDLFAYLNCHADKVGGVAQVLRNVVVLGSILLIYAHNQDKAF